jgi:hypothetical protein
MGKVRTLTGDESYKQRFEIRAAEFLFLYLTVNCIIWKENLLASTAKVFEVFTNLSGGGGGEPSQHLLQDR